MRFIDRLKRLFKRKVVLPVTRKPEWVRGEYYDPLGDKKGCNCPSCGEHLGIHVYVSVVTGEKRLKCPICGHVWYVGDN